MHDIFHLNSKNAKPLPPLHAGKNVNETKKPVFDTQSFLRYKVGYPGDFLISRGVEGGRGRAEGGQSRDFRGSRAQAELWRVPYVARKLETCLARVRRVSDTRRRRPRSESGSGRLRPFRTNVLGKLIAGGAKPGRSRGSVPRERGVARHSLCAN